MVDKILWQRCIMKIFLYVALLLIVAIYALLKVVEPTIFYIEKLTPKNKNFVNSKIISICGDKNITINDKFNKIRYISDIPHPNLQKKRIKEIC